MTETEIKLWQRIRKKQINNLQFSRQRPIENYIVDFLCQKIRLVVEVNGGDHYEEKTIKKDLLRDKYLTNLGYTVKRYTNIEIKTNLRSVLYDLIRTCDELIKNPPSSPFRKGGNKNVSN